MTQQRLSWSWLGLVGALLVLGFVVVFGMFFTQEFRRGLDADMVFMMEAMTPFDMVGGAATFAVVGVPFLVLAWWIANRTSAQPRNFVMIAVVLPTVLMAALRFWGGVGFSYLPNWLDVGFTAGAFVAAAATYVALAGTRSRVIA